MNRATPDNANPTILSLSQLPTREKTKAAGRTALRKGPESRYDDVLFARPDYLSLLPSSETASWSTQSDSSSDDDRFTTEPIDEQEIYDLIAPIADPEHHTLTLGQLAVVNLPDIHIIPSPGSATADNTLIQVVVDITPTINHCSMATVIGLGVRVRLEQALPPNYRVDVRIKEGTHAQDDQTNKQLADKERVAAALENKSLREVLKKMLGQGF